MNKLYNYCTKHNRCSQIVKELYSEAYSHTEELLRVWKHKKGVVSEEFYPDKYVLRLWKQLIKDYGNCSISDVWEIFDDLSTDISQKLNNSVDRIPSDCSVYFGINHLHEGILMVGDTPQIIFSDGPAFDTDGVKAFR